MLQVLQSNVLNRSKSLKHKTVNERLFLEHFLSFSSESSFQIIQFVEKYRRRDNFLL